MHALRPWSVLVALALVVPAWSAAGACDAPAIRYVAPGGAGSPGCSDAAFPCASIQQAIDQACDGDTVDVAEGEYVEDVVIARPLRVRGTGSLIATHLRGAGGADIVRIVSSGVEFAGITVGFTPGRTALRIGDADHPGVRDVRIENATFREAGTGAVLEATGTPTDSGLWIRFAGVVLRNNEAEGMRLVGGNGKLQVIDGRIHTNAGAALRIDAAPAGAARNGNLHIAGTDIYNNGAGIVAVAADGLELEGLSLHGNAGTAFDLDDIQGGIVACNRVLDGADGVRLRGGSAQLDIVHNDFDALAGSAIVVDQGAGVGVLANENLFRGAALPGSPPAVRNDDPAPLDARHSWFGAVIIPPGATQGAVLTDDAILRADAPLLVRRPTNSGWSWPLAACRDSVREAIDAAAPGSMLLLGQGTFDEHLLISKPLLLEGVSGGAGCSPTVIRGGQSAGSHVPTLRVAGTSGVVISNLSIEGAGSGTACGQASGDEVNLDVHSVTDSSFARLCLRNGGVNELRIGGASARNVLEDLDLDGAWRDEFGQDLCGHRVREGVLVASQRTCEGGDGLAPDQTTMTRARIRNAQTGIALRRVSGTLVADTDVIGTEAAVAVEASTGTTLRGGSTNDIVLAGRLASDTCGEGPLDATGTVITGLAISGAQQAIRIAAGAGHVSDVEISCSRISDNAEGLVIEDFAGSLVIVNTAFARNTADALRTLAVVPISAARNYWGSPTGPSGNGPGGGDAVYGAIEVSPWLAGSPLADGDGDGLALCGGDCDDARVDVAPGAVETCDAADNDCNGLIDDASPPQGAPALQVRAASIEWSAVAGADAYDVSRGDAGTLVASGGAFVASGASCIAGGLGATLLDEPGAPAPGAAHWYLVRARNCGGAGSFDAGDRPEAPRDPQLASLACP